MHNNMILFLLLVLASTADAQDVKRPVQFVHKLMPRHEKFIGGISVSANGDYLVSGGAEAGVRLWSITERKVMATIVPERKLIGFDLAFSHDGRSVFFCPSNNRMVKWNISKKKAASTSKLLSSGSFFPTYFCFGRRDKILVCADEKKAWLLAPGQPPREFVGHRDDVKQVALSPDDRYLATVSQDKSVRLWAVANGKPMRVFPVQGNLYGGCPVAFSPDGRKLVYGNQRLSIRTVPEGREVFSLPPRAERYFAAKFSPDGRYLVTGRDRTLEVWNASTGKLIQGVSDKHGGPISHIAFDRSGANMATAGAQGIVLWKLDVEDAQKTMAKVTGPGRRKHLAREWKSVDGKFSVRARYLEFSDGKVQLQRADRTTIKVPLDQLSEADRGYVKEALKAMRPAGVPGSNGVGRGKPAIASMKQKRAEKAGTLPMLPNKNGFCFFTSIVGGIRGLGEQARIQLREGRWSLSVQRVADFRPAAANVTTRYREFYKQQVSQITWRPGQPRIKLIHQREGFCFLSQIGGAFNGGGEAIRVYIDSADGFWYLHGASATDAFGSATVVRAENAAKLHTEVKHYSWSAGQPAVRMIHSKDGFCYISGIQGAWAGTAEQVHVEIRPDGYWYLSGRSGQPVLNGYATSVRFLGNNPASGASGRAGNKAIHNGGESGKPILPGRKGGHAGGAGHPFAGIWVAAYSNGVKRLYVIDQKGNVNWNGTVVGTISIDGARGTLQHEKGGPVERLTLKGESFSGTYLFQATSLTSQARRIAATRFASDALVGKWDIQFKNGVRKQYLVEKSGVVRDGATRMRLLHLADGGYLIVTPRDTLQVVRSISGGKLAIRYYTLATARFPEMPTTIGTATRAGNSDKKK